MRRSYSGAGESLIRSFRIRYNCCRNARALVRSIRPEWRSDSGVAFLVCDARATATGPLARI